jgi:hypothetical protein
MRREIPFKEIVAFGGEAEFQRFKVSCRELSINLRPCLHPESKCRKQKHAKIVIGKMEVAILYSFYLVM